MNLQEVIAEIKKQRGYAQDTLSDANPKTINARKGRKEIAKNKLDELFFEFRKQVLSSIVPVVVIGKEAKKFLDIAKEETGLEYLDANVLYSSLASKLDQKVLARGKESSAFVLEVSSNYLEDTATEIGIASYPRLLYKNKYEGFVKNQEEATLLIKRAMLEQIGPEMNALFILDHAARLAFKDIDSKMFPVGVAVESEQDVNNVVTSLQKTGNNVLIISLDENIEGTVSVSGEINSESVLEALKQVRSDLKNKDTNTKTKAKANKKNKEKSKNEQQ